MYNYILYKSVGVMWTECTLAGLGKSQIAVIC